MRLILALLGLLICTSAYGQGCGERNPNCVVPDRPASDSTNAAANTRFVTTAVSGGAGLTVGSTTITGGTNGKVLFDNSGVVGEQTVAGALVSIVTYSSTQTITIPATATKAFIRMTGGTGGSGGTGAGCNTLGCTTGATGAPGYLEKYLTGLTAGNTLAFTAGAAGSAGASGGGNAGNGTASTLASGTQTIATLTANGSNGSLGTNVDSTFTASTVGGTATNGDVNVTGIGSTGVSNLFPWSNFFTLGAFGLPQATGARAGNAGNGGLMVIMWFT